MNISGSHLSKEFFELIKSIGESRSKQEEDKIVLGEIVTLKQRLSSANVSSSRMKEYLIRSIYVEMLGHDASFSYIHAVKLTQDKDLLCKRIGYLLCSLCLDSQHELLLLLVNTIQKDLLSSNHMEVAAALSCICKLLSEEMIPAIFPTVVQLLLQHSNQYIRKKACLALHAMYRLQPQILTVEARNALRQALCDPDPSVMAASLHLLHLLARHDREAYTDLLPSLVSILKQITEHRLPKDYDYHRIPAPWIQIKLLSLLATLGEGDREGSEHMQEVLLGVIHRAELSANVGFAIIYEAVKAVTAIFPSPRLLDMAAHAISRFISSENHNLKYVGITGLAAIVRVHPSFAALPEHQLVVLDSLEDADETLKRRTLELLFRMTNPVNAPAIVDKLLLHLKLSIDIDFRRELVSKICRLANRFAPDHLWYVRTLNDVLEMGGDLVPKETAHNLLRLIAEGPTGNDKDDETFRREVANDYIKIAEKSNILPDILIQVASWVLGEYGSLTTLPGYANLEDILTLLCNCLTVQYEVPTTKTWILSAIMKLSVLRLLAITSSTTESIQNNTSLQTKWISRDARLIPCVLSVIERHLTSISTDIEQRCWEFFQLIITPEPFTPFYSETLLRELYPFDGACEDVTVDTTLSFLNNFVQKALDSGAPPYIPERQRHPHSVLSLTENSLCHSDVTTSNSISSISQTTTTGTNSLNFTPYNPPRTHAPPTLPTIQPTIQALENTSSKLDSSLDTGDVVFRVQGPRKWGPQGYKQLGQDTVTTPAISHHFSTIEHYPQDADSIPQFQRTNYVSENQLNLKQSSLQMIAQTERVLEARALFSGLTPQNNELDQNTSSFVIHSKEKIKLCTPHSSQQDDHNTHMDTHINNHKEEEKNGLLPVSTTLPDLLDFSNTPRHNTSCRTTTTDLSSSHLLTEFSENTPIVDSLMSLPINSLVNHENYPHMQQSHFQASTDTPEMTTVSPIKDSQSFTLLNINDLNNIKFTTGLSVSPLLEPYHITTAQVGTVWPTLQYEKRGYLQIHPLIQTVQDLMTILQVLLNVSTVEIIGYEGILSGKVKSIMSQINTSIIFIHVKLFITQHGVNIILRGNDSQCLESLFSLCETELLKQHLE